MARDPQHRHRYSKRVNITMPPDLIAQVDTAAASYHAPRSVIIRLVTNYSSCWKLMKLPGWIRYNGLMDPKQIVTDTQAKLNQAVERFRDSLKSLRTGRASASMLDGVVVEAYGTPMPIIQVATVTAPEAQLIQVTPFDPNNLQAIATAIRDNQSLGLNPSDDGHVVRVPIPPLTEERRRELAKQVGQKQEDCMISLRSVRHEALDIINEAKKDKDIGEDDAKRLAAQVEDAMNKAKAETEATGRAKEAEIMKV